MAYICKARGISDGGRAGYLNANALCVKHADTDTHIINERATQVIPQSDSVIPSPCIRGLAACGRLYQINCLPIFFTSAWRDSLPSATPVFARPRKPDKTVTIDRPNTCVQTSLRHTRYWGFHLITSQIHLQTQIGDT